MITFDDFKKLVETFGYNHPLVTFVWNKIEETGNNIEPYGGPYHELFEEIYHYYMNKQNKPL